MPAYPFDFGSMLIAHEKSVQKEYKNGGSTLLPFQGVKVFFSLPKALPWAVCVLAFQAVGM